METKIIEKIKKGQLWKSKDSGIILQICQKWSISRCWVAKAINRKDAVHHIHEGTLLKFYELIEGEKNDH